jgi:hypothetical protein
VSEAGRSARPRVIRVGDFPCGQGVPSSKPRASRNVVEAFRAWFWLVLPSWAEPLAWFSQGFVFFVIECGYPLFRYPTPSHVHL